MDITQIIFWVLLAVIVYTYVGYGVFLFLVLKIKNLFSKRNIPEEFNLPTVSMVISAFNEDDILDEKIENSLGLDYPRDKLEVIVVTDGSDDDSVNIGSKHSDITHLHENERRGKISAMHRGVRHAQNEILVFTDANTILNTDALKNIVRHYEDPKVGCVAGCKVVLEKGEESVAGAGEGAYWKYESALKKMDSNLTSAMGAAGELFSIPKRLFREVESDTVLDDFMLSMRLVIDGYRTVYEPEAKATEYGSVNTKEELKRKIRIAAGGIQSILRLLKLLNPLKYPLISWQYVSHRVLRWTITPVSLPIVFGLNLYLVQFGEVYQLLAVAQVVFYALSVMGWILEGKGVKMKVFYIPFYFCMMNYAVIRGVFRYWKGQQSVVWEKAVRA